METNESYNILAAILILAIVGGFSFAISSNWTSLLLAVLFSALIILLAVCSKKLIAYTLDAGVEHEIWKVYRYGYKPGWHFKSPISAGIIIPLFFTLFSWGIIKFSAILTYETRALKRRAAKRFGFYSFSEMTDWHNGIIGAAGIISTLVLGIILYLVPYDFEYFSKMAIFYAFFNMIPISNLDGTQIFFGSRILYTLLAAITLLLTVYAIIL